MPGIYFLIPRSEFFSIGKIGLISGRVVLYCPNQLVTVNRVGKLCATPRNGGILTWLVLLVLTYPETRESKSV